MLKILSNAAWRQGWSAGWGEGWSVGWSAGWSACADEHTLGTPMQEALDNLPPVVHQWQLPHQLWRDCTPLQYRKLGRDHPNDVRRLYTYDQVRELLLTATAAPTTAAPVGWKLVPAEPDAKMVSEGGCASCLPGPHYIGDAAARQAWRLMVAAAPQAPAPNPGWCANCTPDNCSGCGGEKLQPAADLTIHADFETCEAGITGTTSAQVKRVEHNDDGSLTVVIDHWPAPQPAAASAQLTEADLSVLRSKAEAFDKLQADAYAPEPNRRMPEGCYMIRLNLDGEFGQTTGWLYRQEGYACIATGKPVFTWRPLKQLVSSLTEELERAGRQKVVDTWLVAPSAEERAKNVALANADFKQLGSGFLVNGWYVPAHMVEMVQGSELRHSWEEEVQTLRKQLAVAESKNLERKPDTPVNIGADVVTELQRGEIARLHVELNTMTQTLAGVRLQLLQLQTGESRG